MHTQLAKHMAARVVAAMLRNEAHAGTWYGYMNTQKNLQPRFRGMVVDWLVDVALRYTLAQETLYLAIALLDAALTASSSSPTQLLLRDRFQLLGVTCMFVASKLEDVKPLTLYAAFTVCAKTYLYSDFLYMETWIVRTLNWALHIPTTWQFLNYFALCDASTTSNIGLFAQFITEVALVEYAGLQLSPSRLACAALCIARHHGRVQPVLSPRVATMLNCTLVDVRPCALLLCDVLTNRDTANNAVCKKYKRDIVVVPSTFAVIEHAIRCEWAQDGIILQLLQWGLLTACDDDSVTPHDIVTALTRAVNR